MKWKITFLLLFLSHMALGKSLGEDLYDQGKFEHSYNQYRSELLERSQNGYLLYNMGNAAVRANRINEGLAAFIGSTNLVPRFSSNYKNLDLLLEGQGFTFREYQKRSWGYLYYISFLSIREWVQLCVVLVLLMGFLYCFEKYRTTMICGIILCVFSFGSFLRFKYQPKIGVVTAEHVNLFSGPGTFNAVVGNAAERSLVKEIQNFEEWKQVEIVQGQNKIVGWISAKDMIFW